MSRLEARRSTFFSFTNNLDTGNDEVVNALKLFWFLIILCCHKRVVFHIINGLVSFHVYESIDLCSNDDWCICIDEFYCYRVKYILRCRYHIYIYWPHHIKVATLISIRCHFPFHFVKGKLLLTLYNMQQGEIETNFLRYIIVLLERSL